MTAFAHHLLFEFRAGLRDKTQLLMNYLFPLMFYAMMGVLMGQINPWFKTVMIPSMVIFSILASTTLGLPGPMVAAREAGIYRSYKVNGVPAITLLIIPVLTAILSVSIVTAIIALTAPLLFDGQAPTDWPGFILVFLAANIASAGLGALIGVVATDARSTVLLPQLIFLPSMLLGGLMMPASLLPGALARISRLLPAMNATNAFAGLAMGGEVTYSPWGAVIVLLAGGVVAFLLATFLFTWDSRDQGRRGRRIWALLALVPYLVGMFVL